MDSQATRAISRRGCRFAFAALALGLAILAIAAATSWSRLREEWMIHRFRRAEQDGERWDLSARLETLGPRARDAAGDWYVDKIGSFDGKLARERIVALGSPRLARALVRMLDSSGYPVHQQNAHQTLRAMDLTALPALADGLNRSSTRWSCVQLFALMPKEHSLPPLMKALEEEIQKPDGLRDRDFLFVLIGALGRLKAMEAMPVLEELHRQFERTDSFLAEGIAWSLREITGEEHGDVHDPWTGLIGK